MSLFWCVIPVLVLLFVKAWNSARLNEHYQRSQRALRAIKGNMVRQQPSWITDASLRMQFNASLTKQTLEKGVPAWFLESIAEDEEGMRYLTRHAALMELYGANFAIRRWRPPSWSTAPGNARNSAVIDPPDGGQNWRRGDPAKWPSAPPRRRSVNRGQFPVAECC